MCSKIQTQQFYFHGNILGSRPLQRLFWQPLAFHLIFANCGCYVWSSKYMNMLAWVCGTISCFLCCKSPTDRNKVKEKSELPWKHNIGLSIWHHQSSHLHILHIFQTQISSELMQMYLQTVNKIFILSWDTLCDTPKKSRGKILITVPF